MVRKCRRFEWWTLVVAWSLVFRVVLLPAVGQVEAVWDAQALPGVISHKVFWISSRAGMVAPYARGSAADRLRYRPRWQIHLDYGGGRTMSLNRSTAAPRIVSASTERYLILDLPVIAPGTLTAKVTPLHLELRAVVVLFPSRVDGQQLVGPPNIDLFDAGVEPALRVLGPGFGRLDRLGENGAMLGSCTAFRVAKAYWLTAAHCVVRDEDDPGRPEVQVSASSQPTTIRGRSVAV